MRIPRFLAAAAIAAFISVAALAPSAMASWTSAVRVSAIADTSLATPTVVIDAAGRATAAWAAYNATDGWTVQVARYANGTWAAPTTVSTAGRWAKRPVLGLDGSGNVTLMWAESTAAGNDAVWAMKAATSTAGGTGWTTTTVDSAATTDAGSMAAIAMEPGGDATVAYSRQTGAGPRPYAVRRVAGTWKTPVLLADENASDMAIARTGAGDVVAAWINLTGMTIRAKTLTSTSGDGTWGTLRSISSGTDPSIPFSLAAGSSRVVATWGSTFSICFFGPPCSYNYYVKSARLDPSTGWLDSPALTVASSGTNGAAVMKDDGSVVYSYRGSTTFYARPASGGVLGSPTSTLTTAADAGRGFAAWLDRSGNPVTAWTNTGTVGIGIATNTASGWPASGTAPVVALTSADQPRGASGGSAERPMSMLVATGSASSAPGVFATSAFTTPAAPTLDSATLSGRAAAIAFQAPTDDGGASVTGHTATCASSDGGAARTADGASSPITVPDLDQGRTYTRTVTATNSVGISPASSPSGPLSPASPTVTPTNEPTVTTTTSAAETTPSSPPARRFSLSLGAAPTPLWSPGPSGAAPVPTVIRTQVIAPGPGTIEQAAREQAQATEAGASAHARTACSTVVRVTAAGPVTVGCRLTPRARASLRTRALRLRMVTTFTGADGSVGASVRRVVIPRTPARTVRTPVTG